MAKSARKFPFAEVFLSCGHNCWVPVPNAYFGQEVNCPFHTVSEDPTYVILDVLARETEECDGLIA